MLNNQIGIENVLILNCLRSTLFLVDDLRGNNLKKEIKKERKKKKIVVCPLDIFWTFFTLTKDKSKSA